MKAIKTMILSVVVALASTASLAANDCDYIREVAEGMNYNRQYTNMTKEEALETNIVSRNLSIMYVEDGDSDQSYRDILDDYDLSNEIVRVLYDVPVYRSEREKDLAIEYFKNIVYKKCISGGYN